MVEEKRGSRRKLTHYPKRKKERKVGFEQKKKKEKKGQILKQLEQNILSS